MLKKKLHLRSVQKYNCRLIPTGLQTENATSSGASKTAGGVKLQKLSLRSFFFLVTNAIGYLGNLHKSDRTNKSKKTKVHQICSIQKLQSNELLMNKVKLIKLYCLDFSILIVQFYELWFCFICLFGLIHANFKKKKKKKLK